jgi:hypothetical protein
LPASKAGRLNFFVLKPTASRLMKREGNMGLDLSLVLRMLVWLMIGLVFGIPFLISVALFLFLITASLCSLVGNDCLPQGPSMPWIPTTRASRQWHSRAA